MKKVVNANVGGRSFAFDEDAYSRLVSYFNHYRVRLSPDASKDEVMADLESRIAELFTQSVGDSPVRVVELPLVNQVAGQIGMPDGSEEPQPGTGNTQDGKNAGPDFSYEGVKGDCRRALYRDTDNRIIGGVCSGLAAYLNIGITIVRIVMLASLLIGGGGFIFYLILWIAIPKAKTAADKCRMRGLEQTVDNLGMFGDGKQC